LKRAIFSVTMTAPGGTGGSGGSPASALSMTVVTVYPLQSSYPVQSSQYFRSIGS
jgi:hypothetical protein